MATWICDQDKEDAEQEDLINEWINGKKQNKRFISHDYYRKLHGRKGSARHAGITTALRLDKEVREDSSSTFADLITGSDGRDIENGDSHYHFNEYYQCLITETLKCLGLTNLEIECQKMIWKFYPIVNEMLLPISMKDLELESL